MIDETLWKKIDFAKQDGLIPAIVQDAENGQVLMLAYMSEESLRITLEKQLACYYSRSRQELWLKERQAAITSMSKKSRWTAMKIHCY